MRRAKRHRIAARPLQIQALYSIASLARALGMGHRQVQKLLVSESIRIVRAGRFMFVPLTELEDKLPAVWDSVKAAETLRRALDDT